MGGDTETIKERLDIAEVVSGYVKLDRSGQSLKGRCPFHNEKTPSFFVSPLRKSYYCFGCGAKGDIFTFVQEMEGVDFREALKTLAERAGVELKGRENPQAKSEKDRMRAALETAAKFFRENLEAHPEAKKYLHSRGISDASIESWQLGYALAEWRSLYNHLLELGFDKEILLKAGLIKSVAESGKEPYDVFRDRLIFPLRDQHGDVIAFSGRALSPETEPKYLNSPDTVLFVKSDVLYGLDKAKEDIRKKNYAVLVEGQIDLVLSHQVGVGNTVASSGTAFTKAHLERLKRLSPRIILAFDGDKAGELAAEKSVALAMSLGLETKVARLPDGEDPAEIAKKDAGAWKEVLRRAKPAIEHFLDLIIEREPDRRKQGRLINAKILPLVVLLESSIEKSHFVSLIAQRTGLKEDVVWEDMRRTSLPATDLRRGDGGEAGETSERKNRKEILEERLTEVRTWLRELPEESAELAELKKEEMELISHLARENLKGELMELTSALSLAETSKDDEEAERLSRRIQELHKELLAVEDPQEVL